MTEISHITRTSPDPPEDLHAPPHDHPYLPHSLPDNTPTLMLHRAAGLEDPDDRARAVTQELAVLQAWVEWGSKQRDRAVLQMRERGDSYEKVADVLGVSKSRAQQISVRLEKQYPNGADTWRKEGHTVEGVAYPIPREHLEGRDG